jgi:GT2 family glycosyltransferase
MPAISAILTTHNRAHLLPTVLDALERQTLGTPDFEVVAIDDGSSDGTLALLGRYAGRLPLRVFHQQASGLAAARNLGLYAARAPIIVLLDDDDVADPDLLRAHLVAHQTHPKPATAILGFTRLAPEVARSPLMRHVTGAGSQLFSYGRMKPGQVLGYTEFWGGRVSCKRDFLLKHGVFNPLFRFGYEDIECAWRLRRRGLHVIYEPAAAASMIRSITFDDFCRRSYQQGRSQFQFCRLHPDQEVREYCELDRSLEAWANEWSEYAAILRHARDLDRFATARGDAGTALSTEEQRELDAAYRKAFFLSRAKGVVDAIWLSENAPPASRTGGLGLPGDFAELMARLRVTPPPPPERLAASTSRTEATA